MDEFLGLAPLADMYTRRLTNEELFYLTCHLCVLIIGGLLDSTMIVLHLYHSKFPLIKRQIDSYLCFLQTLTKIQGFLVIIV